MMKRKFVVPLIALVFLMGCTTMGDLPSKCDNIPVGESVLCDMATERDIRIEDVGNAFIVVNAIAIGEGLYTRQEAIVVCEALRDLLDDPITYMTFRNGLLDRVNRYPGLLEVAMSYMGAFEVDTEIYATDRELLVNWLDARITALGG